MKRAVFPGSFDPFTVGHMDILQRACALFDEVIVCVIPNPAKKPMFSAGERMDMIGRAAKAAGLCNVRCDSYCGLTVDYARREGAAFLIRGLRTPEDFAFESGLDSYNRMLAPDVQTVYMAALPAHIHISSSAVRQLIGYNADIGPLVPKEISEFIAERLIGDEQ